MSNNKIEIPLDIIQEVIRLANRGLDFDEIIKAMMESRKLLAKKEEVQYPCFKKFIGTKGREFVVLFTSFKAGMVVLSYDKHPDRDKVGAYATDWHDSTDKTKWIDVEIQEKPKGE